MTGAGGRRGGGVVGRGSGKGRGGVLSEHLLNSNQADARFWSVICAFSDTLRVSDSCRDQSVVSPH